MTNENDQALLVYLGVNLLYSVNTNFPFHVMMALVRLMVLMPDLMIVVLEFDVFAFLASQGKRTEDNYSSLADAVNERYLLFTLNTFYVYLFD